MLFEPPSNTSVSNSSNQFSGPQQSKSKKTFLLIFYILIPILIISGVVFAFYNSGLIQFEKGPPKQEKIEAQVQPPPEAFASTPNQEPWAFEGAIRRVLATDDKVYLAGSIYSAAPNTGHGAPLNPETAEVITPSPYIDGEVHIVIPDGSNGWYIGGTFVNVGDQRRERIAHILPNGSVDPNIDLTTNGSVEALALSSDRKTLYIGGYFGNIGDPNQNYQEPALTSIDTTSGAIKPLNLDMYRLSQTGTELDADVENLLLSSDGSKLYVGGDFNSIGGQNISYVAILNTADNTINTSFNANSNADILDMALSPDGSKLYLGGYFMEVGGQDRNRMAKVDAITGALDTNFTSPFTRLEGDVVAVALSSDGQTLYIGGTFQTPVMGIAAIDTNTGIPKSWNPQISYRGDVRDLVLSSDNQTLYIGGSYSSMGGTERKFATAVNTADASLKSWNPKPSDAVETMALSDDKSKIFVGGIFQGIGGRDVYSLVRTDPQGNFDPTFLPRVDPEIGQSVPWLTALAISPDKKTLYVGGAYFHEVNGQPRSKLFAVSTETGELTSFNPFNDDIDGRVWDIEVSADGNTIFFGGHFSTVNDQARSGIAAANANGDLLAFNPNATGETNYVNSLQLSPDGQTLYVGGAFTEIGGQPRNRLAALNPITGEVLPFNPNVTCTAAFNLNDCIRDIALTADGKTLYIGGTHIMVGNVEGTAHLSSIDTASGQPKNINYGIIGTGVSTLHLSRTEKYLFVGGIVFSDAGGEIRDNVASIDLSTGLAASWAPQLGPTVDSIDLSPSGYFLYAGGQFSSKNDKTFAVWGQMPQDGLPSPTPTLIPTIIPTITPIPTINPTPTPTPTPIPGITTTPTPTPVIIVYAPTLTPTPIPTKVPGITKIPTPTLAVEIPVAGFDLPTIGITFGGILFIFLSALLFL